MNIDALKSLLWWVAIGVFFFWMMRRGGCGTMSRGGHARSRHGDDERVDRSVSGAPIDPVCRMEIEPAGAIGTRMVAGRTFFLCSQTCIDAFDKNPDLYTRGGPADASHHHQHAGC